MHPMDARLVNEGLTPLDPAYVPVMRIASLLVALPFTIGGLAAAAIASLAMEVAEASLIAIAFLPILLVVALLVLMVPLRRYNARGYDLGEDRLRVVAGLLFRKDTVVPFSRVQHIDVGQGPLERRDGIAHLVLHTAGTHNASVILPGLKKETAAEMREAIREHVKRETL